MSARGWGRALLLATALSTGSAWAEAHPPAPPGAVKATAPAEGVVNLNDAGEEELELLPGIGPAKAARIVEHRRAHPFRRVDELTKVKGIGRKTFGHLRPYVTLSGPTTLKEHVPRK